MEPYVAHYENDTQYGSGYLAARSLGWRVLDRNSMARLLWAASDADGLTVHAMVDPMHYIPFANDEFNNVLLNMVCPEPLG